MCGICGILSDKPKDPAKLQTMLDLLAHRGPDDRGMMTDEKIHLGSTRLSIIDLQNGRMPICNERGDKFIVFNGEIYNYKTLQRDLVQQGHKFKTNSDSEVILHAFEQHGPGCLNLLRGMFAFAIWDKTDNSLFLARDHLGQKPLYYFFDGGQFIFASEIKAIVRSGLVQASLNPDSMYHYLSFRFVPGESTMFKDIKKVPPAHYVKISNGNIRTEKYWDIDFSKKSNPNENDLADECRAKISETVQAHLVADVEIGAYLSGGLDSASIVSQMSGAKSSKLKTFSIGVNSQTFNELPYARQVASKFNTQYFEEIADVDLFGSLPQMVWHMDEPSDPIAACMFAAASLASRHVKVVLGGDGGDELFAGFDRYAGVSRIASFPGFINRMFSVLPVNSVKESFKYKTLSQKLLWLKSVSGGNNLQEIYALASFYFRFSRYQKTDILSGDILNEIDNKQSENLLFEYFADTEEQDPIDRMLYADIKTRLPEHTLMMTDRMSMAHGLEARSPLVDRELMEWSAALKSQSKIKNGQLKYGMRRAFQGILPEQIINRAKQGFMFPMAEWFQNSLATAIREIFSTSVLVENGILRERAMNQLLNEHISGLRDHHNRIWMILNLEVWYRIFIENNNPEDLSNWLKDLTHRQEI